MPNTLGQMRSRINRILGKQVQIRPIFTSTADQRVTEYWSYVGFVVLA